MTDYRRLVYRDYHLDPILARIDGDVALDRQVQRLAVGSGRDGGRRIVHINRGLFVEHV